MRKTTTILVLVALLVALGAAQATAQGIPIIFCGEQDPETPECFGTYSFEFLVGQQTGDVIFALSGDDILSAEDGDFRDVLKCGKGDEDFAFFDEDRRTGRSDTVSDTCEFKNEFPGAAR